MILADTSAWVEYDRAGETSAARRMRALIARTDDLAVTESVIMEVTAGARSDRQETDLRRLLARFELLKFDPTVDFDAATTMYRRCRQVGVTPRGLIDCTIAAVALRNGATLLAWDADFARIADVIGISLDRASLRP